MKNDKRVVTIPTIMPKTIELSKESINQINQALISELKNQGLVLVPESLARVSMVVHAQKKQILKKKFVTPFEIAKYGLINNVKSRQTVMNMIADGRIGKKEHFKDQRNRTMVSVQAINRINNME